MTWNLLTYAIFEDIRRKPEAAIHLHYFVLPASFGLTRCPIANSAVYVRHSWSGQSYGRSDGKAIGPFHFSHFQRQQAPTQKSNVYLSITGHAEPCDIYQANTWHQTHMVPLWAVRLMTVSAVYIPSWNVFSIQAMMLEYSTHIGMS